MMGKGDCMMALGIGVAPVVKPNKVLVVIQSLCLYCRYDDDDG